MDYIFEKGKFTEDELEHAIIELFEKQEYTYVPGESIHRQYEDTSCFVELTSTKKVLLMKLCVISVSMC